MNYQDRAGVVHEGEPGFEDAGALALLRSSGWAVQVRTRCAFRMLVNKIVEEPVSCLGCLAKSP